MSYLIQPTQRLLTVLAGQQADTTPVWIMRQAGRYLPEYRALREKAKDFLHMMKTPELACEITLQPLRRFPLDAAILFSDILTIPDAMGCGLHFKEGEGPCFVHPIRHVRAVNALPPLEVPQTLRYVTDAIGLIKATLGTTVPLIGFSGSPWTLAAYMIEGCGTKTFLTARKFLYEQPQASQLLIEKLTEAVTRYLLAQIYAGVDVVMLFDSWGGLLDTSHYRQYSLAAMQTIITRLRSDTKAATIPIICYTKGGNAWLAEQRHLSADALAVDWCVSMQQARQLVGPDKVLQGNLDPAALYAEHHVIEARVAELLSEAGQAHIFNLGHGIAQDVDPEAVAFLVDTVHRLGANSAL